MSSKTSLLIEQYEIGPLNNFIYLLGDPETKEMAIIDPAWDVPFLLHETHKLGYSITKVFLTHAHPDHVNGLPELFKTHDIPIYVSKYEDPALMQRAVHACLPAGRNQSMQKNLHFLEKKDRVSIGNIHFDVLHAPGHTPGCQIFFLKDNTGSPPLAFCGDVLFIDGCGRCDLPGGDARMMYHSLTNVIKKLPDDTIVFPGHNYGPTPTDTIGHQKHSNPYLTCESEAEFLGERMGI